MNIKLSAYKSAIDAAKQDGYEAGYEAGEKDIQESNAERIKIRKLELLTQVFQAIQGVSEASAHRILTIMERLQL